MKRRACPFLTYWTNGDTRNRGVAILRFKQAYEAGGFTIGNEELPDHLAVVLEFAAVGDRVTGEPCWPSMPPRSGCCARPCTTSARRTPTCWTPSSRPCRRSPARWPRGWPSWPTPARPSRRSASSPSPPASPRQEPADDHHRDPAVGRAALRGHHHLRRGHHLALPLRQVRLDDALQPALRAQADPDRQPAVPPRHPGGGRRPRRRPADPRGLDRGGRDLGVALPRHGRRPRAVRRCCHPGRHRPADLPPPHRRPGLRRHHEERQDDVRLPRRRDLPGPAHHPGRGRGDRRRAQLPRGRLGVVPLDPRSCSRRAS